MKNRHLSKLLLMMFVVVSSYSISQLSFNNVYGTPGNESPQEYLPKDDMTYYCGRTEGVASLTLIDPCGKVIFTKKYHFPGLTWFNSMTYADNGDILLLAGINEDWLVLRVDPMGNLLWSHRFSNNRERFARIVNSVGDTYFIAGWWAPGGTSDDFTVLKIDGGGNQVWGKRYNNVDDQMFDVISDGQGGLVACGGLHSTVDMFAIHIDQNGNYIAGGKYWQIGINRFEARAVTQAANGDFLFLGVSSPTSAWNPSVLTVLRTAPNFAPVWQKDFTVGAIGNLGIKEGANGHVYFTTRANWPSVGGNYTITELDAAGNVVKSKMMPYFQTLMFNQNGSEQYHLNDRIKLTGISQGISPFGGNDEIFEAANLNLDLCDAPDVDPVPAGVDLNWSPWNPNVLGISFNMTRVKMDVSEGKKMKPLCDCYQAKSYEGSGLTSSNGLNEPNGAFKIYPNITDGGLIHLAYDLKDNSVAQLEVVDLGTGKRVKNLSIDLKGTKEMTLDIEREGLGQGVYQFTIISKDQTLKQRLVIVK